MTPVDPTRLIHDALPIVERTIRAFVRALPPHVDRDDVRGAALLALVRAAHAADPARLAFWPAYCHRRVTGAMLDELRRQDPARNRGNRPRCETKTVSFEDPVGLKGTRADVVGGGDFADRACRRVDLRRALGALPPRHRRVLIERAIGRPGRAVACDLGVTEGRVSQLRKEAFARCREAMAA